MRYIRDIRTFQRIEKKYLITKKEMATILDSLPDLLSEDQYAHGTITSLYLDTPTRALVRRSIEGGPYKEKLRLRGYGNATEESSVYLELKKKYKGIVYKRRAAISLDEAKEYFEGRRALEDSQIGRELEYAMKLYGMPMPYIAIIYDRDAYVVRGDEDIRITFDRNVRYRTEDLFSAFGGGGEAILPEDKIIMEIKTEGAMPLRISHLLDEMNIFPTSFSKYGRAYLNELEKEKRGQKNGIFV